MVALLEDLHSKYPDTIIVSGGADGVDTTAEQTWLGLGGQVISLRPVQIENLGIYPQYTVERWELGFPQPRVFRLIHEPTWADWKSAAFYRNLLIVEEADRLVAFQAMNESRGTAHAVDGAKTKGIPLYEYQAANGNTTDTGRGEA